MHTRRIAAFLLGAWVACSVFADLLLLDTHITSPGWQNLQLPLAVAMTLTLHARGLFTWPEWAATLAAEIKQAQRAGDPDTGETYYQHWLKTLERLVAEKGVTSAQTLARYHDAWDRAADRTPHGQPIELKPRDFVDR